MKLFGLISLCLLFYSNHFSLASSHNGCGSKLPPGLRPGGPSQLQYISSSGGNRSYLVHLPKHYHSHRKSPLILNYHGNGGNGTKQELISVMPSNSKYILVYPNGVNHSWEGPNYAVPGVSDIKFTIFATGKSNGGGFVGLMTCDHELSSRIKAFAPVAGALYWQFGGAKNCTPSRRHVPIMEFHGDQDKTINPYGGVGLGGKLPSISSWFANKAALSGCHNSSTPEERQWLKGGDVIKDTWKCGQHKPLLVRFNETQMTHSWPGGPEQSGDDLVAATPNILKFFDEWS